MNDPELRLSEALTQLQAHARMLNSLHRDKQIPELWRALGVILMEGQKAMYAMLDSGK